METTVKQRLTDFIKSEGLSVRKGVRTFQHLSAKSPACAKRRAARMLGHRDIHTTQIYARVLTQSVADDGAELVAKIL